MYEQTGIILKKVQLCDKFFFDSKDNILVMNKQRNKLTTYDLNGNKLDELDLENIPANLEFCLDNKDSLVFYDETSLNLYENKQSV